MSFTKTRFHDSRLALHHIPVGGDDLLTSENAPLFTGGEQVLTANFDWYDKDQAMWAMEYLESLHANPLPGFLNWLQRVLSWDWMPTPASDRYDFSKDNWIGAWAIALTIKRLFPKVYERHSELIKAMPVIHKQTLHPLTLFVILRAKHNVKIFDKAIKWMIKRSFTEGHKVRGGRKIAKTDGRIMGLYIYLMFQWDIKELLSLLKSEWFEKPLPRHAHKKVPYNYEIEKWRWKDFNNVFRDFFPYDDHPLVLLSKKIY